jgi:hypothetical protein
MVWLNGSKKIGLTGDYTFHTQSTTTSVAEFGGGVQLVQRAISAIRERHEKVYKDVTYAVALRICI